MNILLNVYPVRLGGGQQVARGFINFIKDNPQIHNFYFFVATGSELGNLVSASFPAEHILSLDYSYLKRLRSKGTVRDFVAKNSIDIIYNYCPTLPIETIPQVVRTVYSNLYFPEIDFWKGYSFTDRIKKRLIDNYRLKKTLCAQGLMFENKSMMERANSLFKYPDERSIYIAPSVSGFSEESHDEKYNNLTAIECFKILYLSSWHLNKNIHILPQVAHLMKTKYQYICKFVMTLNSENKEVAKHLVSQIDRLDIAEYFEFIGKVEAKSVPQVVKSCNAMILLSKLETFSSNVIEAFHFERLLFIADELWSRAACGKGAVYVERGDAENIAQQIYQVATNPEMQSEIVFNGSHELLKFNSLQCKGKLQIEFLEKIYNLNKQ